jgi:hypothetical protein
MGPLRLVAGKKQKDSNRTLDFDEIRMPRLLSVNVGLPRDVTWNGKTVRTGIWKSPVTGRRMVRKLDIDGDAQADLAGHGGEQRAVFVYQMDSITTGKTFSDAMTSSTGSSEKTSPLRDFLITRSASAIDTASVVLNLK